jgi:glycosyltransferase involved in cell wall biosynthesis
MVGEHDVYHICDHSYGQLALGLPAERTGVLCHDIDTFRCLVEPERERRPRWFRWMMRRVLTGFQKAAVVFHTTQAVKNDLIRFGLVDPARLVQAPLGFAPEFHENAEADSAAASILAELAGRPYLLHVGSCIPRKRIDILLQVFAELRGRIPELHLVKVGGEWQSDQLDLIRRLNLESAIRHVQGIERTTLAALYRHAGIVMIPSESEGFGLPALEGLACGAQVLVTDIPVFREVGGDALNYAPLADLGIWSEIAGRILAGSTPVPSKDVRLAQARKYSWSEHARIVLGAYRGLCEK